MPLQVSRFILAGSIPLFGNVRRNKIVASALLFYYDGGAITAETEEV